MVKISWVGWKSTTRQGLTAAYFVVFAAAHIPTASAQAQVESDGSLGSIVSLDEMVRGNNATLIEGGTTEAGSTNLFHSFRTFNINTGQRVYFANPPGITDILSRVTGGNISTIDGVLGVDGNANLFFLNPNGIVFNQNTQLDIGGSFTASTAVEASFNDGSVFSVFASEADSSLSISTPLGAQLSDSPQGDIANAGALEVGQNLTLLGNHLYLREIDADTEGELTAQENITLQALNTIEISNTFLNTSTSDLNANAGDIQIHSQGNIAFTGVDWETFSESGTAGDVLITTDFGNIVLTDVILFGSSNSGATGETILTARSGSISLNGSSLFSNSFGASDGGEIVLDSPLEISLTNGSQLNSGTLSAGSGGNITIRNANVVRIEDSIVLTGSSGQGQAGDVVIADVGLLLLRDGPNESPMLMTADGSPMSITGSLIQAGANGTTASGGNVQILDVGFVVSPLNENNDILADAAGGGDGGTIIIRANRIIGFEEVPVFDSQLTENSSNDISARSGGGGVDGEVTLENLAFDPTQGLNELPTNPSDASNDIAAGCRANARNIAQDNTEDATASQNNEPSTFTVTGRGGLPANPSDSISADLAPVPWVALPETDTSTIEPIALEALSGNTPPLRAAQGWVTKANGEVVFVADPQTNITPQVSGIPAASLCPAHIDS